MACFGSSVLFRSHRNVVVESLNSLCQQSWELQSKQAGKQGELRATRWLRTKPILLSILGWSIETSISEDPQPHPQSLRFFEVEDRHFRNFEVFWGWGLHKTFEVFEDLPSKNLKVWGEDEVYSFEVFWGFLKIPWKIQPKGAFINYIDRF